MVDLEINNISISPQSTHLTAALSADGIKTAEIPIQRRNQAAVINSSKNSTD